MVQEIPPVGLALTVDLVRDLVPSVHAHMLLGKPQSDRTDSSSDIRWVSRSNVLGPPEAVP